MLYVLYLNLLPPVVTVTNLEEILNEITHQHPTPLAHNMHMLQESAQKGMSVVCVMFFYLQLVGLS